MIDPTEIGEEMTLEIQFQRRGEQRELFPAVAEDAPARPQEVPALPIEPPAVPLVPPPGQEGLSMEQRRVIAVLEQAGRSLRLGELIKAADVQKKQSAASKVIERLARLGHISKDGYGRYRAVPQQTTAQS